MSLIDDLRAARGGAASAYHEFLLDYKPNLPSMYCFFEGQDDPSFYLNFISRQISKAIRICIYRCKNKSAVYESYRRISIQNTKPGECLFFVDKDLSEFTGEIYPASQQIFVTSCYSIENYLVSVEMLKRIWIELFHFRFPSGEFDVLAHKFEVAQAKFYRFLLVTMAWSIYLRRAGIPSNLNGLDLCKLFQFNSDMNIEWKISLRNAQSTLEKLCQTKTPSGAGKQIRAIAKMLLKVQPKLYIRGKFELWFLVQFVKALENFYKKIADSSGSSFNVRTSISLKNAVEILGPRLSVPVELESFLGHNIARLQSCDQQLLLLVE